MTTEELMASLPEVETEEEMLEAAQRMGFGRAFFNVGSAVEEKPSVKNVHVTILQKGKKGLRQLMKRQLMKKTATHPV